MFKVKRNQSAEKMISETTDKITSELDTLCTRKNDAIFMFRSTLNEIDSVNEDLNASLERLDNLVKFVETAKESAKSTIAENNRIRAKIIEIVGED